MAFKLVVLDLDDTLLRADLSISFRNKEVLSRVLSRGILVTLATGRMYPSALPYARELGISLPIITYNGAMIRSLSEGKVLFHRPIDPVVAREVLLFFREAGCYIQAYVNDELLVEKKDEKALEYARLSGVHPRVLGEALYELSDPPTKLLAITGEEEADALVKEVRRRFEGRLWAVQSKRNFVDMAPPSVNKGRAVAFLAERLNIPMGEVLAIGDSDNDAEMIAQAGMGIAMGNASSRAKAAAKAIAPSNEEDGVAWALEYFVLKKQKVF